MRHSSWLLTLAIVVLPTTAQAQNDFEAFKKKESERMRSFLTKEDADFSDFLKQDWKEFALSVADKPLVRPKPRATPIARPTPPEPSGEAAPAPAPAPTPLPGGPAPSVSVLPSARRPAAPPPASVELAASGNVLHTMFFGGIVAVPKVSLGLQPLPATITGEAISAFWEQINASPYKDVLAALQKQRELMQLGDWAFAQLAFRTGLSLAGGDTTHARLIAWHFLVKSGYATRVGYSGSNIHVLLKTDELLYGVSYFTIDNGKFYVLDLANGVPPRVGAIRTYEKDHPSARKSLSFFMNALPLLPEDLEPRTLRFAYKGQKFEINAGVNRNLVQFLTNYPQTRLNGYLDAEVPSSAMDAVVGGLQPIIAGRPELEQVDMILRFVQTAFDYKTDGDQFAREKWMFPEETLFYPFSDCEDRAILFSYLVRKLVPAVSVVGLIYSDHVAAAVRFNTVVTGDVRMHRGIRYVVSDPTYINASVGMEMDQYKGASPTIVDARSFERR
ncbi:MAG: hypothetical protein WD825_14570 [Gemmatimonadaceae bacterium]